MKKQLLLTLGILTLTVIVLATALSRGRHIVNRLRPTRTLTYTRNVEGGTLSRQINEIRQRAYTWELPNPNMLIPAERALQLDRLREFATNLNAGGTELSDLRIIEIADNPDGPRHIHVMFMHEDDYNNAELVAEMLEFTGICEDDIYIRVSASDFRLFAREGHYEFMLSNQAVYDFLKPYLLLREFAMYANSGTTYVDEIVVTSIINNYDPLRIDHEIPPRRFPGYSVGLSPNAFNDEVRDEIMAFTGLARPEVQFTMMVADDFRFDFLQGNDEWMQLAQQRERLHAFQDLIVVRSVRQDIIMDRVLARVANACFRFKEPGDPFFGVMLRECMYDNAELKEALLAFTGIDEDNISFLLYDPFIHGTNMHTLSRHWLTPRQRTDLEALETYMEQVNALFWHDRYRYDPMIVSVDPLGRQQHGFGLHQYIITLYDPDLIGRSRIDIAWRTRSLRTEIIAATGVSNFRFVGLDTPWTFGFVQILLEGHTFTWFFIYIVIALWILNIYGFAWIFMMRKESRIVSENIKPTRNKIPPAYRFRKKLLLLPAAWIFLAVCVIFLANSSGIRLRSDLLLWSIIAYFILKIALCIYLHANVNAITKATGYSWKSRWDSNAEISPQPRIFHENKELELLSQYSPEWRVAFHQNIKTGNQPRSRASKLYHSCMHVQSDYCLGQPTGLSTWLSAWLR